MIKLLKLKLKVQLFGLKAYELWLAVYLAHALKDKPLDVKHDGCSATWSPKDDLAYLDYTFARNIIAEYPRLEKLLGRYV